MSQQDSTGQEELLSAIHVLEYPYTRSTGDVLGRFLGGLRDGHIEGAKTPSGKVIVPPTEFDPETGDTISELVEVADCGVVTTWSWIPVPRRSHPLDRPFAWALIRLDGADTAMLHAVDAGSIGAMSTGMRVRARWKAERVGAIGDIECFEPEESA